jgi:alpha-glucosidase
VWSRTVVDGEPVFAELAPDGGATTNGRWWVGEILVRNPVARYRFFVEEDDGAGWWLNQRGVVRHDPADDEDFRLVAYDPPPAWAGRACLYQILPDRFARSGQVRPDRDLVDWDTPVDPASDQWYGGDLWGIAERLDHVAGLGVTGIYLTPVFPAAHSHRYNASTFAQVDPLLGGDTALIGLTSSAHARGLRVIGDLTANHSGDTHEWFESARADPSAPERAYYLWEHYPDAYECWGGFRTLPRFDHADPGLRQQLLTGQDAVAARWLRTPVALDGWRVDAANVAGRAGATDLGHRVASDLRATMGRERPDGFLFAEHCHDASGDLDQGGWHATMDYSGFTRPVWSWLLGRGRPDLLGLPVPVVRQGGVDARRTMDTFRARVSWQAHRHRVHLLGSHDTSRWRSTAGDRERTVVGFGLLATMPGIPSLFAGDEIGMTSLGRGDARAPFPWEHPERWDRSLLRVVRRLLTLRQHVPALTHGGFRWVSTGIDHMTFLREHEAGDVLVHVARGVHRPPDLTALGPSELLYGEAGPTGPSGATMLSPDAGVTIRQLESQA